MSSSALMQDGGEYPRQPSHYLNQVPVMAQSAEQMEAYDEGESLQQDAAANDSKNLIMQQNQQQE